MWFLYIVSITIPKVKQYFIPVKSATYTYLAIFIFYSRLIIVYSNKSRILFGKIFRVMSIAIKPILISSYSSLHEVFSFGKQIVISCHSSISYNKKCAHIILLSYFYVQIISIIIYLFYCTAFMLTHYSLWIFRFSKEVVLYICCAYHVKSYPLGKPHILFHKRNKVFSCYIYGRVSLWLLKSPHNIIIISCKSQDVIVHKYIPLSYLHKVFSLSLVCSNISRNLLLSLWRYNNIASSS